MFHHAEDYAKALEKDKKASKPRRKSHAPLGLDASRADSLSSALSPDTGLIPTARTAPTAAYQPYLDGAHLNSRPGTPAEASPSFGHQSGVTAASHKCVAYPSFHATVCADHSGLASVCSHSTA